MTSESKLLKGIESILEFCFRFSNRPDEDVVELQAAAFELRDKLGSLTGKEDSQCYKQIQDDLIKLKERMKVIKDKRDLEHARMVIDDENRLSGPMEKPDSDSDGSTSEELVEIKAIPLHMQDQIYRLISDIGIISAILDKCDRAEHLNCQLLEEDIAELELFLHENKSKDTINIEEIDGKIDRLIEQLEEIIVECNVEAHEEEQQDIKMAAAYDKVMEWSPLDDETTRSDLLAMNRAIADLCSIIEIHRTEKVTRLEASLEEHLATIDRMPHSPVDDDEKDDMDDVEEAVVQMHHILDMLGDFRVEYKRKRNVSQARHLVVNNDFQALKSRRAQRIASSS